MRKILMSTVFGAKLIALSFSLHAQVCTPDTTITQGGYHPDTLPWGYVNQPYEHIIQAYVPTDTIVLGLPATIDSMRIDSVIGMPPSFSYACNKASCSYLGGEHGCIRLTGNPDSSEFGVWRIIIWVTAYINSSTTGIAGSDTQRLVICYDSLNCPVLSSPKIKYAEMPIRIENGYVRVAGTVQKLSVYALDGTLLAIVRNPRRNARIPLPKGVSIIAVETRRGRYIVKGMGW